MLKKLIAASLLPILFISGLFSPKTTLYQTTWLDVFDTVTTLRGYAVSQEAFDQKANAIHEELLYYHKAFDVYNSYDGMTNLKDVNDAAGTEAIAVDSRILDLVEYCRECWTLTNGRVNAAAGSMLVLWHEARMSSLEDPENAALPDMDAVQEAMEHISFDTVIVDREAGTILITDPQQRLDVGAIAKGWAGQQVRKLMPEGYMISLGGNVCARGTKPDGSAWKIGIQSPMAPDSLLCVAQIEDTNVVSSGDYQRYFTVDGVNYHHIIDPDTGMPAGYWRGVTIVCEDSGLADCLSTALFLMPMEEGRKLAEAQGAEVLWVAMDETITTTDHFPSN